MVGTDFNIETRLGPKQTLECEIFAPLGVGDPRVRIEDGAQQVCQIESKARKWTKLVEVGR